MANVFDQFDSAGNVFDQFDETPAVTPGDVEARRRQVEAIPDRPVRPEETIGSTFTRGLNTMAEGVQKSIENPLANLQPFMELFRGRGTLRDAFNAPGVQAIFGGQEALFSPTQPVREVIRQGAERTQDALLPHSPTLAAALGTAVDVGGNLAADAALFKGAGKLREAIGQRLPLNKQKAAAIEASAKTQEEAATRAAQQEEAQANRIYQAQKQQLDEAAQAKLAAQEADELAIRGAAEGAPTSEQVGRRFIERTYPEKLQATKESFNTRYDKVLEDAAKVELDPEGYAEKIKGVLGEGGLSRPLSTKAETVAAKAEGILTQEDETYKALRAQFSDPNRPDNAALIKKLVAENNIQAGKPITLDKLILERQRLKAGERAALDVNNDPLHHQLKELRLGLEKDIAKHQSIATKLSEVDAAYRTEYVPFFGPKAATRQAAKAQPASMVDRFIPPRNVQRREEMATRAKELVDDPEEVVKAWFSQGVEQASRHPKGFGPGLSKWLEGYMDEARTGNTVLRTWLGDRRLYDLQDVAKRLRTVEPGSVEKALSTTLHKLNERAASRGRFAFQNRDAMLDKMRKDVADQIKAITGETMDPKRVKNYGMFLMIEGVVSSAIGSPTGGLRALAGGLMVVAPNTIAKVINAPGGLQLIRRGLRAVPGTEQAAVVARQLKALEASLPDDTEETIQ